MEKSFLELLKAEANAVNEVESFKCSVECFLKQAETAFTLDSKEVCKRHAYESEKKLVEAEENLLRIRKEMKQYISFLETL